MTSASKRYVAALHGMRRELAKVALGNQVAELAYTRHRDAAYRACNDPELRGTPDNETRITAIEAIGKGWLDATTAGHTARSAIAAEQSRKLREEIREMARNSPTAWMNAPTRY